MWHIAFLIILLDVIIIIFTATATTAAALIPPTIAADDRRRWYARRIDLAAREKKTKTRQGGKGFGRSRTVSPTERFDEETNDNDIDSAHAADDTTNTTSPIHAHLIQWLSSHCNTRISSKFSIRQSSLGGGYGGFANTAISQHELILQIPRQLCVTQDDVLNDPSCGHVFQSIKNQRISSWGMILLAGWIAKEYVIAQREFLSPSSNMDDATIGTDIRIKHNPYLQSLPWTKGGSFSQDHVLFWSNEEVETLLGGSKAYEDAMLIRNTVDDAIQRLVDDMVPILIHDDRLANMSGGDDQKILFASPNDDNEANIRERYSHAVKGAFVIALSRSFAEEVESDDDDGKTLIETENVLLPLIDILQHSNTPNTVLESYDDYILLRARRDIALDEELYHQYQEERDDVIPPHKFFTRYGFIAGVKEPIAELLKRKSDLFF